MKQINVYYQGADLTIDIPDNVDLSEFAPVIVDRPMMMDEFESGWRQSGGDKIVSNDNILFVVNDGYRTTPTAHILKWLVQLQPELIDKAHFLIACGTHEPPLEKHYNFIFDDLYGQLKDRIYYHNCFDKSCLREIGIDHFGEKVYLNKKIFEYDKVIFISSVDPHYFAGLTGGRKSLLPGLSDFSTIERNHNLANSLDAMPLRTKCNPVAEHMAEILEMVDDTDFYSIQAVIDAEHNLASVFFGSLKDSFERAAKFARGVYSHSIKEQFDIAICEITPPLDNNLYQAQKALENCQQAVKDKGTIIIMSACEGGVGSQHFWELADNWDAINNCNKDGKLHFGSHKLYRVNLMQQRINVRLYSSLKDDIVSHVFYEPAGDIYALLETAGHNKEKIKIAVIHNAGHTVLKI